MANNTLTFGSLFAWIVGIGRLKRVDIAKEFNGEIRVLSLCSGGAGLDIGLKLAIPTARVVAYVERESFAVSELLRRMEAGELDEAPICTDIRELDGKPWRGIISAIIGGIPCQPWSTAGKRGGTSDE